MPDKIAVNADIEELIVKSFAERLSSQERTQLQAWLAGNEENERIYADMKNLWQVSSMPFDPGSVDVESAVKRVFARISGKSKTNRQTAGWLVWWQRVAAVLILPALAAAGYMALRLLPGGNSTDVVAWQEVSVPCGFTSKLELPDGSLVWINSGSKLRYPVVFTPADRTVKLSGEAYFEVASDEDSPFIVETGDLLVKATGTAFNVDAYGGDPVVSVTLVEGRVEVTAGNHKPVVMSPDQRLLYDRGKGMDVSRSTSSYKWISWKDGVLVFRDDPLEYVFKRIGLMYNIDIAVMDAELARQPYRATFEDKSLQDLLRLIQKTAPIRYVERGKGGDGENVFAREGIEVYAAE